VTSGAYGHHLGRAVALVTLTDPDAFADAALSGDGWAVDVAGERVPATVSARPFYDPGNERLRS
jgi:4-methylaminobutanoate oxidase (formaldehyde-forming)